MLFDQLLQCLVSIILGLANFLQVLNEQERVFILVLAEADVTPRDLCRADDLHVFIPKLDYQRVILLVHHAVNGLESLVLIFVERIVR